MCHKLMLYWWAKRWCSFGPNNCVFGNFIDFLLNGAWPKVNCLFSFRSQAIVYLKHFMGRDTKSKDIFKVPKFVFAVASIVFEGFLILVLAFSQRTFFPVFPILAECLLPHGLLNEITAFFQFVDAFFRPISVWMTKQISLINSYFVSMYFSVIPLFWIFVLNHVCGRFKLLDTRWRHCVLYNFSVVIFLVESWLPLLHPKPWLRVFKPILE